VTDLPQRIDIDQVVAIDVHTHVQRSVTAAPTAVNDEITELAGYFRTQPVSYTVDELAASYRERNMAAVTFIVDVKDRPDDPTRPTNEEVATRALANQDVIIPFASIDPARGAEGVREAQRLIRDFGVRGFKFHPSVQAFQPNDRLAYPLYEVIEAAGLPALFHSGQTGVGSGQRAGGGVRLAYSNPMFLDDVAVDFPDLPIVLAHPSFPWQEEALAVALHKPLVYIDLSGWSPKYFPSILVQYANTLLKEKVLFGTDFPVLTPERWMEDLAKTALREQVKPGLFKYNAARLLGLTRPPGQ
jgi:predicted TIM-barrel fold metal-dependent hydrolase